MEQRVGGRAVHPLRPQWPSEEGRGEGVDPTMTPYSVEISIAGGVDEMFCESRPSDFFLFLSFFLSLFFLIIFSLFLQYKK